MEAGKTGALLSCAAAMGAILAGAPAPIVDALADFGRHLGIAFQAVDDVLGIWGEPSVTGKPVGNDLRQHKKTLPVAHRARPGRGPARRARVDCWTRDLTEAEVAKATLLLEQCGARQETTGHRRAAAACRARRARAGATGARARARSWRRSPDT